ncbi:MAG: phosphoribosylamine--glycine ligase [Anaerolineae bacterium]|nr:phosphoribosylamine--glycine ligase [Anaerolineae bacterium]
MSRSVMIVGSGGREHALAWKVAQSPRVSRLYLAPGNAAQIGESVRISGEDLPALRQFAIDQQIDLTIVGPEAPLAAGIVDLFQAAGLAIFGPSQAAAQLEASKAFSKQFMQEYQIPTAAYASFSDYEAARAYLDTLNAPVVVKASGLAAGKGVIVCDDSAQAHQALQEIMRDQAFGAAGATVVIEERLTGREVSVLAFSDGDTVIPMPPARDHKRVFDGDQGPNTGGMGAYAPVPDVDAALLEEIHTTVLQRAVDGMRARGTPYVGVLYAGLMLTPDGIRTLEYNCRFGDPETQVLLPLLDSDLVEVIEACITGRLADCPVTWRDGACATVVLAAPGYPGHYPKGSPIHGIDQIADAMVFQAGTVLQGGQIVTAGGRVLAVSALDHTLNGAIQRAYQAIPKIHFDGMHYRRDIGQLL